MVLYLGKVLPLNKLRYAQFHPQVYNVSRELVT